VEKAEQGTKVIVEQLQEKPHQGTQETVKWNQEPFQEEMAEQTDEIQEEIINDQKMVGQLPRETPRSQGSIPMMTQSLMIF
jgi:hypothetical protein